MFGLAALLVFVSLALAGYGLALWAEERQAARRALASRLQVMTGPGIDPTAPPLLRDQRLSGIPALDVLLGHVLLVRALVRMVRQAGLKRRVGEVLLYVPLLAAIGFLLCALVGAPPLAGMIVAAVSGSTPLLVVQRIRRRRMLLFGDQLPDALDLVRSALQAGHGFVSALGVVAETFPDPIAQELRYVGEEVRLGLPMRDALYHLAERVDDPNLPILVIGILVAQEIGGNLAEVIDNIGYTIRERAKLLRETRVLTAQGRLSGKVLTALPFGLGLFMYFLNPVYFAPMVETPKGQLMLAYSGVSVLLGHLAIRRLVRVKV